MRKRQETAPGVQPGGDFTQPHGRVSQPVNGAVDNTPVIPSEQPGYPSIDNIIQEQAIETIYVPALSEQ